MAGADDTTGILELSGISRRFGGLSVIDDLDLRVDAGEIVGIIGPNGAGKTTLFNMIGGVLSPSDGKVVFRQKNVTRKRVWNRCRMGIGRTYQMPKPFAKMSVFENVLAAAIHGGRLSVRQARARVEEVLTQTGLLEQSLLEAERLPLLDLKRLELAKALAQKPELLLLDEIAGGLTSSECDVLLEVIGNAHAQGMTVVWIEHVIQALRQIATRIVVLHGGGIIADDTPDTVLNDARVRDVYLGEVA